ncbi:MAG: filamentous hemagglutinin N-terminal domain-containing protein, partial [Planctomycetota bacterium]|nr:filamentous hemagglutinin N-terminal domain-containing protein [Planctomycetota bacterium]
MEQSIASKLGRIFLSFLSLFIGLPPQVWAGPANPQVVNGQVQFNFQGQHYKITASDRSIINYSGFDIAADETVQFIQPRSDAWVLNRVLSSNPTEIYGRLLANGRVALVNPAGIYFGPNAVVDVNRFLAAAMQISDESFLGNDWDFNSGDGAVVNDGEIRAERTFLLGRQVFNNGSIIADDGVVMIAAKESVLLR